MIDVFTIIAWVVLAVLFLVFVSAIVYLGSLPGNIAKKRNHPQADAINAASWIGLALLGAGWPIAFVWAFLKSGPIGSDEDNSPVPNGVDPNTDNEAAATDQPADQTNLASIATSLAAIEQRLNALEQKRD